MPVEYEIKAGSLPDTNDVLSIRLDRTLVKGQPAWIGTVTYLVQRDGESCRESARVTADAAVNTALEGSIMTLMKQAIRTKYGL